MECIWDILSLSPIGLRIWAYYIRFIQKNQGKNRVRTISSTYSICDFAQLTVKPFAVLTRQMSTCASTVDGFIVQKIDSAFSP